MNRYVQTYNLVVMAGVKILRLCLKVSFAFFFPISEKNLWVVDNQVYMRRNKKPKQIDKDISVLATKCFVYPFRSQLYSRPSLSSKSPVNKLKINWIKPGFKEKRSLSLSHLQFKLKLEDRLLVRITTIPGSTRPCGTNSSKQ